MSWARAYRLGNRAAQRWYGTASIVYTDTTGHVDTVRAIFDEAYQLEQIEDNAKYTFTRPVLSVRYADFVNATLEAESRVVIGSRTFVVDGVERTGYEDARLILQEVTA